MKIYIASLLAVEKQGKARHVPVSVAALSDIDACKQGYDACLRFFPTSQGWRDHSAAVMEAILEHKAGQVLIRSKIMLKSQDMEAIFWYGSGQEDIYEL